MCHCPLTEHLAEWLLRARAGARYQTVPAHCTPGVQTHGLQPHTLPAALPTLPGMQRLLLASSMLAPEPGWVSGHPSTPCHMSRHFELAPHT